MIKVQRTSKPKVLEDKAADWTSKLMAASTRKEKKAAENRYRHNSIKVALKNMFHDKCAYCESKISHIDYGHIDHYKPKNNPAYRNLTFDWDNFLLSCAICNGAQYKGTKFPLEEDGGPLVNPCEDDPSDHFDFVYDSIAKLASVVGKTERGETTERILGLNRAELRNIRSNKIKKLLVLKNLAQSDPDAAEILLNAKSENEEYSAFARCLL